MSASPLRRTLLRGSLSLVLALVLLEVGLRVLAPRHAGVRRLLYSPTHATRYDELETLEELVGSTVLGWRPCRPYLGFDLNSRSLRTHEYTIEKEPGTYRIVVLGDSFTFSSGGTPHSQMWHTVMGRELEAARGQPVEVISLGLPAVGPQFELRMWQLEGARLDADLVVLAFFVGNDFTDEQGSRATPLVATSLVDRAAQRSVLVRLARNLARSRRQAAARGDAPPPEPQGQALACGEERPGYAERFDPDAAPIAPEEYLRIEGARMILCHRAPAWRKAFDELLVDVGTVLEALAGEVRASGAELCVVLVPDEYQVDPALREELYSELDATPEDFDLDLPQRELGRWLEERGIRSLDVLPVLRAAHASEAPVYGLRNTHWNPRGNGIAGRRIAEALVESK